MKQTLILFLIVSTFLAACAPPTPTPDINATISSMSGTSVAATLTAQPTSTSLPTDTPLPTETALPTGTPTPIITNTPLPTDTPIVVSTQTSTPVAFVGCFIPTGATSLTAPFKLENYGKVTATVYINGTTTEGDHTVSCSYSVEPGGSTIFTIWFGKYSYWVEAKKTYSGTFFVNDSDKATMQITEKGIKIGPFP